jgi:hypothetical protein
MGRIRTQTLMWSVEHFAEALSWSMLLRAPILRPKKPPALAFEVGLECLEMDTNLVDGEAEIRCLMLVDLFGVIFAEFSISSATFFASGPKKLLMPLPRSKK